MSTDVKPQQGRHRAAVSARTAPATFRLAAGGAVVLLVLITLWQAT